MTFEEGTCAAWLHDLLEPHVRQVLVGQKRPNQRVQRLNRRQYFDFNPGCAAALAKSMAIGYMSRTPAHESVKQLSAPIESPAKAIIIGPSLWGF